MKQLSVTLYTSDKNALRQFGEHLACALKQKCVCGSFTLDTKLVAKWLTLKRGYTLPKEAA